MINKGSDDPMIGSCNVAAQMAPLLDRIQNELNHHLDRVAELRKCIHMLENSPEFYRKIEEFNKALGRY